MSKREKGWKKRTRRLTALMVSLLMLVTMIPAASFAASDDEDVDFDGITELSAVNDVFEVQSDKPKELDKYPDDVYGVDADPVKEGDENDNTPFLLSEQNELQLYYCGGVKKKTSGLIPRIITEPFKAMRFTKLNSKTGVNRYGDPSASALDESKLKSYREMSFTQGIGFDAEGTGRKEYTAIIGLKSIYDTKTETTDYKIMLIVQNASTLGDIKEYDLGKAEWMHDINKSTNEENLCNIHLMDNYFSITAGDYDGDGRESVMAYACLDGSDPKIVEVGHDKNGNWYGSAKEILKIKDVVTKTDWITSPNEWRFKPAVSLATGDFDGDNYPELAYSAGFYNNSYNISEGYVNTSYSGMKLEDFATMVGVCGYNEKTDTFGDLGSSARSWLYESEKKSGSGTTVVHNVYMLHGGAITAGDIDGDKMDEIVAAGYTSVDSATATFEKSKLTKVNGLCNWDNGKIATSVIEYAGNEYKHSPVKNGITELNDCFAYNLNYMNMADTYWVLPQLSLACAKTNGATAPEDVFISGTIFDFSKKKPASKYTADYFSDSRCYRSVFDTDKKSASVPLGSQVSVYTSLCTWVRNVTSGNFIQSPVGREQFVFTVWGIGSILSGTVYDVPCGAVVGMIGGDSYNDETDQYSDDIVGYGEAGEYKSSPVAEALNYYSHYGIDSDQAPCCTVFGDEMTPTTDVVGAYESESTPLTDVTITTGSVNAIPIAVDTNNDGMLGRFNNKGFIYTDPQVIAVLQAAPYFSELNEAGGHDYGETSYGIVNGFGTSTTSGDTVGFEVGFAAEAAGPGLKVAYEAGYAMEWSHEYEKAYSVETEESFVAGGQSIVVISRVPQLVYAYDIYDEKTDSWITNGYSVQVPLTPRYFMLSIDEYNVFVDQYNAYAEKAKVSDRLLKIEEGKDLPSGHEGIPENYWKDSGNAGKEGETLSAARQIGHSGGSSAFDRTKSEETTDTESVSHGFHFGITVQAGADFPGGEVWAGGYANLDYSHSTGYSETKMSGETQGGRVMNIDGAALKTAGFSTDEINKYSFKWEFGQWKRQLQDFGDDETVLVPFCGFFVDDVSRPAGPAAISGQSTIKATEGYTEEVVSTPYNIVGTPMPTITINEIDERITYNSETRQITIAPGLPEGNYKVTLRADNGYGVSKYNVLIQIMRSPDHKAADRVTAMINELNIDNGVDMTQQEIEAVDDASSAYSNLSDAQKQYISEATLRRLNAAIDLVDFIRYYSGSDFDDYTFRNIVTRFEEIEAKLKEYSEGKMLAEFVNEKGEILYELEREINTLLRDNNALLIELMKTDYGKNFWDTVNNIFNYYGKAHMVEQRWTDQDIDYYKFDDYDTSYDYNTFYDKIDQLGALVEDLEGIDPNNTDYSVFDNKYEEARDKVREIFNYYFACEDNSRAIVKFTRVIGKPEYGKSAYLEMLDLLDAVLKARESKIINNYEFIQQVVKVEKIINDLPTGTDLKAKHEEDVKKAREEYEKLTDEQKNMIDPAVEDKLKLCELIIIERKEKLINISGKASMQLEYSKKVYTGAAYTPKVTVKLGNEYLKQGEDYFIEYKNNKAAGLATVVVIGDNDYTGAIKATFQILPRPTSIKKVKAAKKALKIYWKKQSAQTSGYQIQLSTKKSFKKKATKTVTVSKAKITSKTVKKLKAKKKYYVRIRTFKKVGKTKYYSTWSPVRTGKTKK